MENKKTGAKQTGIIYEAIVGKRHFGMWKSKEDAECYIKNKIPSIKPFEDKPTPSTQIPEGMYYIQIRPVYSFEE